MEEETKTFNIFKEKGKIILQAKKGDKGDSPTKDELLEIIEPLIPEPIKGKDGKDYVLTQKDKKEIAKSIVVQKPEAPIVNVPPANITVTPAPVEFPSEMKVIGMDKLIAEVSRETEDKSIFEEVTSKNPLSVQIMDSKGKPITNFGGDITAPSVVGLKNTSSQAVNPATEETLQSIAGMSIPQYDYIGATYPLTTQEVYTYKIGGESGTVVGTVTVNYTDATKAVLSSVIKT